MAAAVIVPPLVLYGAVLATALGAAAVLTTGGSWALLRPAVILGVHLPLTYAIATLARGMSFEPSRRSGLATSAVVAAVLMAVLDLALPGHRSPVSILALGTVASVMVPPTVRRWRSRWERFPDLTATLVVATASRAADLIERLEAVPGLRIASVLIPDELEAALGGGLGRPVYTGVVPALHEERRAIVSSPERDVRIDAVVARLVARDFEVASESSVLRAAEGCVDSSQVAPLSLLLGHPRRAAFEFLARVRDLALAVLGLVLLTPVLVAIAVAIRWDSRGPVFFRQWRLGARGRPFRVLKFRTMRQNAEAETGPVWASENDARVTRVGRFLRRTRLDEVPQLVNVILGHMALVGPRPERAHFYRKLRGDLPIFELRTAVRPGITGWAQIRAPYAAHSEEARIKLDHDLFYLSRRSLGFDLAILFDTVAVSLCGKGAR